MKNFLQRLLRYPVVILAVTAVITIVFFAAMKQGSRMETDLDKYMPQHHPAFVYSDQAEEWFDIRDGIIIAIENPDGIYNPGTLKKTADITLALGKLAAVDRNDVTSLFTADNITGTEEGLDVRPFFRKVPADSESLEKLRNDVRGNDMAYGRLVSEDETVTVIIAAMDDKDFTTELYHEILSIAESFEGPESIYVAGRPIVEGTMAYLGPRDMKKMVPIVIFVIAAILVIVLKSAKAAFFTLMVVLISTVWTFGLKAVLGIPVYAVSTMIPVMLIAIGVADGIHLFNHMHLFISEQERKGVPLSGREYVLEMVNSKMNPVIMTSVTTAVGFVALLSSQVYPIKYFGLFTAFGVMAAMALSLLFIPSALLVFGLPGWKHEKKPAKGLPEKHIEKSDAKWASFAENLFSYRYLIAVSAAAVLAISVFGMTRVWIDSSFLSNFEKESEIVRTDNFINAHFGGTSTLNVILDTERDDSFKEPHVLRALDSIQSDVEKSLDMVGGSFSLADYLKRMNMVMNADNEYFNVIPDSKELTAQYLLLYEMSGDPENLWKVTDVNYRKANLTFQIKSDSSLDLRKVISAVEKHMPELRKLGITLNYAGSGYKALVFTDLILQGQIASIIISLVIVMVLLSVMFRSIGAGVIGSVPIIITAFTGFGIMGLAGIPLTTTTALLSSIAIGIGIDFAVHFIDQYKTGMTASGSAGSAGVHAMQKSGRALLFNAFVVISGFIVLLFSAFPPNRALGALVSLNMAMSLTGTLTIMYIMLLKFRIFQKQGHQGPETGSIK